LGFRSPFFHKLVDVLARTMGDVFPEIRSKQKHIEDVLKLEEETFNKTLDKGITLFNEEVARLTTVPGSAPAPGASAGAPAGVRYTKRHLPHFERPWAKYMVTFSTSQNRHLTAAERDIVMASIRYGHDHAHYELYAACVMPDHVHLLLEPQIKSETNEGETVFYSLTEILQAIKSTTAHRINKAANVIGVHVWEEESFDRLIRGDADLQEKFEYICRNPWDAKIQLPDGTYPWLWTSEHDAVSREGAENSARGGRAPRDLSQPSQSQLSAAFAFKLYDEQGFPLDLTELMARERGLTVDTEGFNTLMEAQRARARAAQKKQVITLSEIETTTPTVFTGYDSLTDTARVLEVLTIKDRTAVILDRTSCYAEMGGQVGDTAEITRGGQLWRVANTQKTGNTWLHLLDSADAPNVGDEVQISVNAARRAAIQRHHTVTHLLHWALHEVVSPEATQKGSAVSPEKLTFDFNSAALTPQQVRDIEKLVNERILENASVSWTEVPYAEVRGRADIMQFFGDKYGDTVRVVQIGGTGKLNGYSMELCAGTHTRATGEIGLFRILAESAIAAGVRRIEAIAGLEAAALTKSDAQRLHDIAGLLNAPAAEIEKKIEALLANQKELEKALKAARTKEAAASAKDLAAKAESLAGIPFLAANLGAVDGDHLQAVLDALKSTFEGVTVLASSANNAVSLAASVSPAFTSKIQAGKIIQTIAPIVGGKGGGKPDMARGGGKDTSKIPEALATAKAMLGAA
ncbi:MAG: alanine--tRNA ligase-related protein, partial [Spartobacteria bacterium]